MRVLAIRATQSPANEADYGLPVLLTVVREQPGPAIIVGHFIMDEADAATVRAGVDVWQQVPMVADAIALRWDGPYEPPAMPIAMGKIGKVLKMFGVRVGPPKTPPPPQGPALPKGGPLGPS